MTGGRPTRPVAAHWRPPATARTWIAPLRPLSATARGRLVVVPHAGAGPHVLMPLVQRVAAEYDVLGVTLPGRERRLSESATTTPSDPGRVVAAVLTELADLPSIPTVVFGHSLGAAIAAAALAGAPELFVGGVLSAPPPGGSALQRAGRWREEELLAILRSGGATPEELLHDRTWRREVLDRLRSDLTLSVRLAFSAPAQPIPVPLTVLGGDRDAVVPADALDAWRWRGTGGVRLRTFPGGHFFLLEDANLGPVAAELTAAFGAGGAARLAA